MKFRLLGGDNIIDIGVASSLGIVCFLGKNSGEWAVEWRSKSWLVGW